MATNGSLLVPERLVLPVQLSYLYKVPKSEQISQEEIDARVKESYISAVKQALTTMTLFQEIEPSSGKFRQLFPLNPNSVESDRVILVSSQEQDHMPQDHESFIEAHKNDLLPETGEILNLLRRTVVSILLKTDQEDTYEEVFYGNVLPFSLYAKQQKSRGNTYANHQPLPTEGSELIWLNKGITTPASGSELWIAKKLDNIRKNFRTGRIPT